ncbi:MAG: VacB/RNase II family 3'-5' exoribonuclease [Oscillospiraceae bacterium]|nr:VacB/RNase II family 3'-5' exoribonuclease [Oscillospiraceae bacterium]
MAKGKAGGKRQGTVGGGARHKAKGGVRGKAKGTKKGGPKGRADGNGSGKRQGTLIVTVKGDYAVIPDDGSDRVRIPREFTRGALRGDKVAYSVLKDAAGDRGPRGLGGPAGRRNGGNARSAKVDAVTGRAYGHICGILRVGPREATLHDRDSIPIEGLSIRLSDMGGATDGQAVKAKVYEYGKGALAKVVEVYGLPDSYGTLLRLLLAERGMDAPFPPGAEAEAEAFPDALEAREAAGRSDFRAQRAVTIDGPDTKDVDDAVYLEGGAGSAYTLWVHIADVAHYVAPATALDAEAYRRGTSVYPPGSVVPMLPTRLSNGLCSLDEGRDRLAVTVRMAFDPQGGLLGSEFMESVVNVSRRLTYGEVDGILSGGVADGPATDGGWLGPMVRGMGALAALLKANRESRGSIDFDLYESEFTPDGLGGVASIVRRPATAATRVIEEFMVAANEAVASYADGVGEGGFVFRTHGSPDAVKLSSLGEYLEGLGIGGGMDLSSEGAMRGSIQGALREAKGTKAERAVNMLLLRSMAKAVYHPDNAGHYGLGSEYYCHFTSPIRRYPDLLAHRFLKRRAFGAKGRSAAKAVGAPALFAATEAGHADAAAASAYLSEREREAEEVDRTATDIRKAEYMARFIGRRYGGAVSSVTPFGFFVELDNTVEGLVRVSSLADYYRYDEPSMSLRGETSGKVIRMGDEVAVTVSSVQMATGKVTFLLADEAAAPNGVAGRQGPVGVKGQKNKAKA